MSVGEFRELTKHVDWFPPDDRTDRPALGAIHGRDATLLVEGGASPAHLAAFLAELRARGRSAVDAIVLTHWHWDHSFGSSAADVPVIAHRETARQLAVQASYAWDDAALDQRVADGREIAFCADMIKKEMPDRRALQIVLPTIVFDTEHELDLGGVELTIKYVGGDHASDSSVVYVQDDRVLFLGDALYENIHSGEPWLSESGVAGLLASLEGFEVEIAVESHEEAPHTREQYENRLAQLRAALEATGTPSRADDDDDELAELVTAFERGKARAFEDV